jgi:hypothetical protein
MAQIDASIPLGIRPPEIENPVNALAKVLQVKSLQTDMAERQRAMEDQQALRAELSAPGADPYNALLRRGRLKEATDWAKGRADVAKTEADTKDKGLESIKKRVELAGQAFGYVKANPTMENALSVLQSLEQQGIYPPEQVAQMRQMVQASPGNIAALADQAFRAALATKDQLAKYETRNLGGTTDTIAIDPVSGQARTVNSVQNTQSPDNKASVGASLANAAATREVAAATRDAARISADKDREMKLGDDWRAQSKGFKEVADAYKIINASLDKATTSPAATLAGATKFMKLLDPGSVVRESELGMALAAAGVFDRAANYINTLQNGKVLTAKQAQDFKGIAAQIYKAAQQGQKEVDANYRRQAETYGLRPDMIVQDLGQNKEMPVDLGALPSGGAPAGGKPKIVDFGSLR